MARPLGWHWALPVAAVFLVVAYTYPKVLAPLNRLWLKFGLLLYKVVNPVILGLLFFVTIMPIGLLMRACGKDFLRLRLDRGAKSYWIERDAAGAAAAIDEEPILIARGTEQWARSSSSSGPSCASARSSGCCRS